MTNRRPIIKIARTMFKNSLTNGRLDEKKVQGIIKGMLFTKGRQTIEILKAYRRLVLNFIDEQTAKIQSPYKLSWEERKALIDLIEKIYQKELNFEFSENRKLLGGIKVRVGDSIWDASLEGKLLTMRSIYE